MLGKTFCLVNVLIVATISQQAIFVKAYRYCAHGDVVPKCETHGGCNPDNACYMCECYQDAWDCYFNHPEYGRWPGGQCPIEEELVPLTTYGSSTYLISQSQKSWNDSVETCKETGGTLAVMNSDEEFQFLQSKIKAANKMYRSDDIWLGAKNNKGTWSWLDGRTFGNGHPSWDSWAGRGECLNLQPWLTSPQPLKWNRSRCWFRARYICEIPTPSSSGDGEEEVVEEEDAARSVRGGAAV